MFVLDCSIVIQSKIDAKSVVFEYVNEVQIKTSCNDLTDTAVVKIPQKIHWQGRDILEFIAVDSAISIYLGYQSAGLGLVFKGYISAIDNHKLLTINCENEMRRLKKVMVKPQVIKRFNPKTFAPFAQAGIRINMPDSLSFGSLNIQNEMSIAEVLSAIRQKYPYVKPFFTTTEGEATLHIINRSMQSSAKRPTTVKIGHNTISDTIKYIRKEDVKIAIKAIHITNNNKKIEVSVPKDTSGCEIRTFHKPECDTEAKLKTWAENELKIYKEDKADGNVTLFGVPFVRKTDSLYIEDEERPEINGKTFFVPTVNYSFGAGGYRQVITLGDQIKNGK